MVTTQKWGGGGGGLKSYLKISHIYKLYFIVNIKNLFRKNIIRKIFKMFALPFSILSHDKTWKRLLDFQSMFDLWVEITSITLTHHTNKQGSQTNMSFLKVGSTTFQVTFS